MKTKEQFVDEVLTNESLTETVANLGEGVDIDAIMKSVREIAESFADAFVKMAEAISSDQEALNELSESLHSSSTLLNDGDSDRKAEDG
jgi:hypothetical protein